MARIVFTTAGTSADVATGVTLAEAAALAGAGLLAPCGGTASCGRCRVLAHGELSAPGDDERDILGEQALSQGWRLACRARVEGDVQVSETPAKTRALALDATGRPAEDAERLGIAIDLGTTTMAAALVSVDGGEVLASATADNPQRPYGADVVSRLTRVLDGDGDALRAAASDGLDRLCRSLVGRAGAQPSAVERVVLVGNPAMVTLLLGDEVSGLAFAPYHLPSAGKRLLPAADAGLPCLGATQVWIPPAIGPFIGADVVAGLLATGVLAADHPTLYADLGTNGELALVSSDRVLATSTAAGPAFEAAGISSGVAAVPGAVERVRLVDHELIVETIDGAPPLGICGSGLLDLVAVLVRAGAVDSSGRLLDEGHPLTGRVTEGPEWRSLVVVPEVSITQADIRALQLAKGAVQSGIRILLGEAGVSPSDLAAIVIAGGFGRHVDPGALAALGIIDDAWRPRVGFAGNAALLGAVRMLAEPGLSASADELVGRVEVVDLATHPVFQKEFLASLDF